MRSANLIPAIISPITFAGRASFENRLPKSPPFFSKGFGGWGGPRGCRGRRVSKGHSRELFSPGGANQLSFPFLHSQALAKKKAPRTLK